MMNYSIVIPVYNSSKTLPLLIEEIKTTMVAVDTSYEVIFVDDCSTDTSWGILKRIQVENPFVKIIRLANNVGQWMATLAGIKNSSGKLIVTIDDDLEFDTGDIAKLIQSYHQTDAYIIYGIPTEKKNKNLSYKLFFTLRDRFLRIFFDKIQTESFKIFKREIYFDEIGNMLSHLHFEAYTKFTVAQKYIGYQNVNYRSRYFGNSNHTVWMKTRLMIKYGIEYYKSPFRYPTYFLLFLLLIYFPTVCFHMHSSVILIIKFFISMSFLLIIGILGKYLSSIYFKLKGLPEYIIIEEQ